MASKSKPKAKSKRERAPSSTQAGRTNILLEHMQSQFNMVIDGLQDLRSSIPRQLDQLKGELSARIDALEVAVRLNSEEIRKNSEDIRRNSEDIRKNSEDIRKNSEDIQALCAQMSKLNGMLDVDAQEDAIANLRRRMRTVEDRLGIEG